MPAFGADPGAISFNRDVRPILANNCFRCHGPDAGARKAELRLDQRDTAIEKAITPGDAAASRLLNRVTHDDPERRMPPHEAGEALTEREIEVLADWIDAGAAYQRHWAYERPVRPPLPAVNDDDWPANPIDRFILSRLETDGIEPAPEAEPAALVRRLHFDIIGLPPTPGDLKRFNGSSFEKYVDALLKSPHYGERMAIGWLDLVRYADSTGYHGDEFWDVFPYRDYVIDAFNANKPFDQFTIEQIAGDLLPGKKQELQIASAYNRLNQVTTEGGANAEEYLIKYASDRARTTATAWMGATIGCAECHDHKYDPISTRDFYAFTAFFADIEDPGKYSPGMDYPPYLELPSKKETEQLRELEAEIARTRTTLQTPTPELKRAQAEWEAALREAVRTRGNEWKSVMPLSANSKNGTDLRVLRNGAVLAGGATPPYEVYTVAFQTDEPRLTGLRLEALEHDNYQRPGRTGSLDGAYQLSEIEVRVDGAQIPIARAVADSESGDAKASLATDGNAKTAWSPLAILASGNHQVVFVFDDPVPVDAQTRFEVSLHFESFPLKQIEHFSISVTSVNSPELDPRDGIPPNVVDAVLSNGHRTARESRLVFSHFAGVSPLTEADRVRLLRLTGELRDLKAAIAKLPITVSKTPRPVHILNRGNWMAPSEETVLPQTLSCVPPVNAAKAGLDRLDLARWIVSEENPLTARVFVNRLWAHFFGNGLSNVLDDLGTQGEWPTHPGLLDWMAVEFMESGWDVKHMVRLIVTSRAYRQSSAPRPELAESDPNNRLYARQSRSRLGAELVRDNALAISGLLNDAVGGRSAFPYQPEGLYEHTNTQTKSRLEYHSDPDENQYRRGLYTIWKRSFLHPSMQAFDAPAREECTADRVQSNTPLQALVLLNDPSYVEAARAFAERIVREGGETPEAKARWAFEHVLLRPVRAPEVDVMVGLYERHRLQYAANPEDARAFMSIGLREPPAADRLLETAAWTPVARALLNLHETITRS